MFSFSSHQIGYVGETPLLFEQIKEAEAELKQRPDSLELLRKCCIWKCQFRENYTNPKFLLPMLEAEQRNVQANPKEANAHPCLAYVLLKLERFPEAEKAARTALELDPEDIETHYCVYSVLKDYNPTVAEQHLKQVEKLIPNPAWIGGSPSQRSKQTPRFRNGDRFSIIRSYSRSARSTCNKSTAWPRPISPSRCVMWNKC